MKLGKFLFMSMLSGIVLTACVDNDDKCEWNDGSQPVSFTSSIKGVNTRAVDTKWTAGDKVGIFMKTANGDLSAAIAVNKLHTTDESGNLTASNADNALYYPANGSVDFIAYYPYTASLTENTYKVDVATQTDQPSIDLLYSNNATNFAKGTASKPQLQFAHMLSQIVFNIEKDATIPSLNGLKVTFEGMNTKADFALANGALSNAGTVAKIDAVVNEASATAKTIVLPASALSGIKVVFALNGKSYTADYPQATLEGGSKYTHKVTLSDSNGQPVIEMEAATITGWTEVPGDDIEVDFGDGGVTPTEVVLLDEPFDANQGGFTIDDKTLPEGSTYVWKWNTFTDKNTQITTQYMKASAFINNANKASESWLISPAINLSNISDANLSFEHCHKFGAVKEDEMSVWIANAGTTDWHQLTIPTWGTGNDYTYVTAEINLKAYIGNSVQIAFKYVSTESAAATWQINAVKVIGVNGEGGGEVDPPTPGGEEKTIFEETFGDATGKTLAANTQVKLNEFTGFDNTNFTFFDRFADPFKNADIRTTKSIVDNHLWLPAYTTDKEKPAALKISGFNVEGYTNLKLSYSIAANAATDQNIIKVDCGGTMMAVPSVAITKANAFQTVELESVPDGITYIELISDATNKIGFRIDNIKLVGTTK